MLYIKLHVFLLKLNEKQCSLSETRLWQVTPFAEVSGVKFAANQVFYLS